jgi:hypothetical protein
MRRARRTRVTDKTKRLEKEREAEQREGLDAKRRGSPAAPSDRPENEPPHPQDVNEIAEES